MKIPEPSSLYPTSGVGATDAGRTPTRTTRGSDSAGSGPGLAASVNTAASAADLTTVAMSQPDMRQGLVQALQARVNSGNYSVDSQTLAGALLDDPQTELDQDQ